MWESSENNRLQKMNNRNLTKHPFYFQTFSVLIQSLKWNKTHLNFHLKCPITIEWQSKWLWSILFSSLLFTGKIPYHFSTLYTSWQYSKIPVQNIPDLNSEIDGKFTTSYRHLSPRLIKCPAFFSEVYTPITEHPNCRTFKHQSIYIITQCLVI